MEAGVKRHRFTAEEYRTMAEVGLLHEDDRVELIGGEVVDMAPIEGPHLSCVVSLTHLLVEAASGRYFVSVQNPVSLGGGDEPQPDLSLLRSRPKPSVGRPPGPEEVLLVIEVSDTTLAYDKNVKLALYASAGIPEAWIVDLRGRRVEIHSDPGPDGYRSSREASSGDRLSSVTIDGLSLPANEILG